MNKIDIRHFVSIMEFFYGFLFGVAVFGATLTFLVTPDFFLGILFAVCVFAFFIFLTAITRYCVIRIKIAEETLHATLMQSQVMQEQVLKISQQEHAKQE